MKIFTFNQKIILISVAILLFYYSYAQVKVVIESHYLFPEFTKGSVLMKSGIKSETMLNYNSLTEEMIFDNNGTKMAMAKPELVDTVYIAGRKFFLYNKKFIESIYKSTFSLYAEHRCSLIEPGKPAAYGGTSQTSASTSYSSYSVGGQIYQLKLPEGYQTKPFIDYWLKKDGKMEKFLNLRQLSKLFGDKERVCKEYIKAHDVKYTNQESIVGLIRFLETQ